MIIFDQQLQSIFSFIILDCTAGCGSLSQENCICIIDWNSYTNLKLNSFPPRWTRLHWHIHNDWRDLACRGSWKLTNGPWTMSIENYSIRIGDELNVELLFCPPSFHFTSIFDTIRKLLQVLNISCTEKAMFQASSTTIYSFKVIWFLWRRWTIQRRTFNGDFSQSQIFVSIFVARTNFELIKVLVDIQAMSQKWSFGTFSNFKCRTMNSTSTQL